MNTMWMCMVGGVVAAVACFGGGCGDDEATTTGAACPTGICTTSGGPGGGVGGGGSTGGGGPGGGPPTCAWTCSPWETRGGNAATRTCVDADGCADSNALPPEAADLPALDENFYRCRVEPVIDKLCSQLGCHGVEPDLAAGDAGRALRIYHRGRLRITGDMFDPQGPQQCGAGPLMPSEECIGSLECGCGNVSHTAVEWRRNFDAARGLALDPVTAIELIDKTQAELLTQPDRDTGLVHAGIKLWRPSDASYVTVRDWLQGATLASCTTTN